jgi:hypothetical protein
MTSPCRRQTFAGLADPVESFYAAMNALSRPAGRETKVAYEPDGRQYGPAIFRVHYDGWAYAPHVNHVRLGDELGNFSVARYAHQARQQDTIVPYDPM